MASSSKPCFNYDGVGYMNKQHRDKINLGKIQVFGHLKPSYENSSTMGLQYKLLAFVCVGTCQ